jgi:hypothetical protein
VAPKEIHVDFERALANGLTHVFPTATVLKDFFHFIQANVKRIGQDGLKSQAHNLVVDLNELWEQPTEAEFHGYLKVFLDKWQNIQPNYAKYFSSTWIKQFNPSEWASCARPSNSRSGMCSGAPGGAGGRGAGGAVVLVVGVW